MHPKNGQYNGVPRAERYWICMHEPISILSRRLHQLSCVKRVYWVKQRWCADKLHLNLINELLLGVTHHHCAWSPHKCRSGSSRRELPCLMCVPGSVWLYLSGFHGRSCSAAQKPGGGQQREKDERACAERTHTHHRMSHQPLLSSCSGHNLSNSFFFVCFFCYLFISWARLFLINIILIK